MFSTTVHGVLWEVLNHFLMLHELLRDCHQHVLPSLNWNVFSWRSPNTPPSPQTHTKLCRGRFKHNATRLQKKPHTFPCQWMRVCFVESIHQRNRLFSGPRHVIESEDSFSIQEGNLSLHSKQSENASQRSKATTIIHGNLKMGTIAMNPSQNLKKK